MEEIPWGEFLCNVSALGSSENALSRMVWIRTETNNDIIDSWSPEAKRINSEWRNGKALEMSEDDAMEAARLAQAFFDGLKG